jgi:hypothetical protein
MVRREILCMYICVGYDGEGCDWHCTDENIDSSEEFKKDAKRNSVASRDGDSQSEWL